ncbi:MAG: FHA domain-containing protein [Bacteroidales bacterium]
MNILDKVVKLEKRIEKLTARGDVGPSPLEIRRAILDDIEEHVQPAGRGRRVFPYDRLAIDVLAAAGERAAIAAVLDPDEGFTEAIRERLREAGCDRIGKLQVQVKTARKPRPEWATPAFNVAYERSDAPTGARSEAAASGEDSAGARTIHLAILEGDATRKTYPLSAARTNIGRLAEVTDRERRVVRRNQVVFLENDTDANQSVSRAHAHITCSPSGDYRLYDDHSSYGTRVVRDGKLIELPSGSPRGVKLQAGDEIYFGRARAQFLVK